MTVDDDPRAQEIIACVLPFQSSTTFSVCIPPHRTYDILGEACGAKDQVHRSSNSQLQIAPQHRAQTKMRNGPPPRRGSEVLYSEC